MTAMGRKNRLLRTTGMGAGQVATIQTRLATCRAHGSDPYARQSAQVRSSHPLPIVPSLFGY